MIGGIIAILSSVIVSLWMFLRARTVEVEQLKQASKITELDVQLGDVAEEARKADANYDEFVKEFDRRNPGLLHDLSTIPGDKSE